MPVRIKVKDGASSNGAIDKAEITKAMATTAVAYEAAKRRKEEAELAYAEAEQAYLDAAFTAKRHNVSTKGVEFVATNNIPCTVTLVDGTDGNSTLDEATFAKLLGPRRFARLTSPVLDRVKLQSAIDDGSVKKADVLACTTVKDKKSYGRITPKVTKVRAAATKRTTTTRG